MKKLKRARRQFLRDAGMLLGAASLPALAPSRALGRDDQVAASNRVVVGCVGSRFLPGSPVVASYNRSPRIPCFIMPPGRGVPIISRHTRHAPYVPIVLVGTDFDLEIEIA